MNSISPTSPSKPFLSQPFRLDGYFNPPQRRPRAVVLLEASHVILAVATLVGWVAFVAWLYLSTQHLDRAAACLERSYRDPVSGRMATMGDARLDGEGRVVCGEMTVSRH